MAGFSLIEMLVVLAISFLITGISLVAYGDYYKRKVVRLSAENWAKRIELLIKKTQSGAVVKDFGANCSGIFEALRVIVNANTSDYNLGMICSKNTEADRLSLVNQTYKIDQLDVNKSVVFDADRSFDILPLSKGIKITDDIQVGFRLSVDGAKTCSYDVVINKQGDVDVVKR